MNLLIHHGLIFLLDVLVGCISFCMLFWLAFLRLVSVYLHLFLADFALAASILLMVNRS